MASRKTLERDIDRWISKGWVDPAHREAILQDAASRPGRWSAAGAGLILGAVLLALAALSFVAANWAGMPKLARFAVILAALWGSLGGAGWAFARNNAALGHALALIGAALFGAAILLTAQTFNMSAFRNTAVLIWSLAALLTAIAIPSRPVLGFAALLGVSWLTLESFNPLVTGPLWGFLALWAILGTAAIRLQSLITANLLGAGAIIWLASLARYLQGDSGIWDGPATPVLLALFCGAGAMILALAEERGLTYGRIVSRWLSAGAVFAAFIAQFSLETRTALGIGFAAPAMIAAGLVVILALARLRTGHIKLLFAASLIAAAGCAVALPYLIAIENFSGLVQVAAGAAIFALAAAMVAEGAHAGRGFTGGLGLVLFIAQALHVYTALFGSLLDTALFFLVGGLLLIAMSVLAMRWQKRTRAEGAQP